MESGTNKYAQLETETHIPRFEPKWYTGFKQNPLRMRLLQPSLIMFKQPGNLV